MHNTPSVCHIIRFAALLRKRVSAAMDRRHWAFCAVCCVAALCWLGQPVGAQIDYPLKGQSFARRPIPALEGSSRLTINATALLERALTLQIHDNSYQVSHEIAFTLRPCTLAAQRPFSRQQLPERNAQLHVPVA